MAEITLKVSNLLTFAQAAKVLGVSRPTVYNLVKRGKLHAILIGGHQYCEGAEVKSLK